MWRDEAVASFFPFLRNSHTSVVLGIVRASPSEA